MTLSELLKETGDWSAPYSTNPESTSIYVYTRDGADPRYWRLDDYGVSGTTSGPGIVLHPAKRCARCQRVNPPGTELCPVPLESGNRILHVFNWTGAQS